MTFSAGLMRNPSGQIEDDSTAATEGILFANVSCGDSDLEFIFLVGLEPFRHHQCAVIGEGHPEDIEESLSIHESLRLGRDVICGVEVKCYDCPYSVLNEHVFAVFQGRPKMRDLLWITLMD